MPWNAFTPLTKGLIIGGGVLLLIGLMWLLVHNLQHQSEVVGGQKTTIEVQKKVIDDVQTANQVRQQLPTRTPIQHKSDCVRRSRTPENCQ